MNKLIFNQEDGYYLIKASLSESISKNVIKSATMLEYNDLNKEGKSNQFKRTGSLERKTRGQISRNGSSKLIHQINSSNVKQYKNYTTSMNSPIHPNNELLFFKFIQYFKEEPLRTPYGRGYFVSENIDSGIRYIKIKYKYGYGMMKYININDRFGKYIEKEIIFDSKQLEEIKISNNSQLISKNEIKVDDEKIEKREALRKKV